MQHQCADCGSLGMDVRVYGQYFHVFFIPAAPIDIKDAVIHCTACGERKRSFELEKYYEGKARMPFYLYGWPILFISFVAFGLIVNQSNQNEKAEYIKHPKVSDIYQIRISKGARVTYSFMKVVVVNGDSVIAIPNSGSYAGYVSEMQYGDSFIEDSTILFLKSDLKNMLDEGVINAVER